LRTKETDETKKKKIGWIIVLFIVMAVAFSSNTLKEKVQNIISSENKTLKAISQKAFSWPDSEQIKVYNENRILQYINGQIINTNFEGIKMWNKSIIYEDPLVYFGIKYIYIADTITGEIIGLNQEGEEIWRKDIGLPIKQILEDSGYLMTFSKVDKETSQIDIFNQDGEQISSIMEKGGSLIGGGISTDRKKIALVLLDISKGLIESKLNLYSIEGKLIHQEVFKDEIVGNIRFVENSNLILFSDKKVFVLSKNEDLLWSRDVEGSLKGLTIDEKKELIYILHGHGPGYLESISFDGRTQDKIELSKEYHKVQLNKDEIFLLGERHISAFGKGNKFLEYTNEEEIKKLEIINGDLIMFTSAELKIMKLVNFNNNQGGE